MMIVGFDGSVKKLEYEPVPLEDARAASSGTGIAIKPVILYWFLF